KENLFPQEALGKIFTEGDFKFLDLRSRFQEAQNQKSLRSSDFFLFNDHCHLSVAGHALVAGALADHLGSVGFQELGSEMLPPLGLTRSRVCRFTYPTINREARI